MIALILAAAQPFSCTVASVTDSDTIRCQDGTRVRLAAINAREKDGSCRKGMVCPVMRPEKATRIVESMVLGQRLTCLAVGKSWNRIVATCRFQGGSSVSCSIAATGAAAWEPGWARRYKMEECDG